MRGKLAVIAAVAVFVCTKASLDLVGGVLGIVSYIDYGSTITVEHPLYDEEIDGATTDFGMFGFVAGALLAWRAFHWIKSGSLSRDLTANQRDLWMPWLLGATVYTALSTFVTYLDVPRPISWPLKLAIAGVTFYLGRRAYDNCNAQRRQVAKAP
jgi:hypothetical protein